MSDLLLSIGLMFLALGIVGWAGNGLLNWLGHMDDIVFDEDEES